jgi:hypothetical protein
MLIQITIAGAHQRFARDSAGTPGHAAGAQDRDGAKTALLTVCLAAPIRFVFRRRRVRLLRP